MSYYDAGPAEYDTPRSECTAPNCAKCGGCEAACDTCVSCRCVRCDACGYRVTEHSREGLTECGLWCYPCKGLCSCGGNGASCGHCGIDLVLQ